MKKMLFIFVFIIVILNISVFGAEIIGFEDVPNDYWGKGSIEYISSNKYMVGYGNGFFGVNDALTQGQYLAVLCRIFGYEMQSPLTVKEPALELGLLIEGENIDVLENITRGDMAKYTIRAFEKLNPDITYPDYLQSYKGMVLDYNDLPGYLKPIILKCVEKGLIKGMPDGTFRPGYTLTRAEAAVVIHRLLNHEEREKAKPIFAEPDPEFEVFMASPEAEEYCSIKNIHKIIDGKIIWGGRFQSLSGELILPNYYNPESNKEAYVLLRNLVMYAKENGHYVKVWHNNGSAIFKYYENRKLGENDTLIYGKNFSISIDVETYKFSEEQKEYTYYSWSISQLVKSTVEDWAAINYRSEDMTEALKIGFQTIYGADLGLKIFDFAISEYDNEREYNIVNGVPYSNEFIEYREDLGGLEINNYNTEKNALVLFTTNR